MLLKLLLILFVIVIVLIYFVFIKPKKLKPRTDIYVMAPLNLIDQNCQISDFNRINKWLKYLSFIHVDGIMVDVWWGIVESKPNEYNFSGYKDFFSLCKKYNLKVIPVMSFHQCGTNVGDDVFIPLPDYVLTHEIFFIDNQKSIDNEYISLFYDDYIVKDSTTVIEAYAQMMAAFQKEFSEEISSGLIHEIEVGVGPCGELRYPSYRDSWEYPGSGAIQVFDSNCLNLMKENGIEFPLEATLYNDDPLKSEFWLNILTNKKALEFFDWYNKKLCEHGERVLSKAREVFGNNVKLACKIAGIHWWSAHISHAAEATCGLFTFINEDSGYSRFAKMFAKFNVALCFTCLEMTKGEYFSDPPFLVQTVLNESVKNDIEFEGENALECYDCASFSRILRWSNEGLKCFTILRLGERMMKPFNFLLFIYLVWKLHSRKY